MEYILSLKKHFLPFNEQGCGDGVVFDETTESHVSDSYVFVTWSSSETTW